MVKIKDREKFIVGLIIFFLGVGTLILTGTDRGTPVLHVSLVFRICIALTGMFLMYFGKGFADRATDV